MTGKACVCTCISEPSNMPGVDEGAWCMSSERQGERDLECSGLMVSREEHCPLGNGAVYLFCG